MPIFRACALGVSLAVLVAVVPAGAQDDSAEEIRLGKVYASRLEAQYRLAADAAALERLARVGGVVTAASDRPGLPYTFKILSLDMPNALSLPGGFIYVTTGLLSFVRSDHELAAVLAHEVVHAAHRHQIQMIRRSNEAAFWTLVVAMLSREAAIAAGAQLVSLALLSGYTRDLERDADLTAIAYLVNTPYSPVAVLTLMERLAREEQLAPQRDSGAFRDHPTTAERAAYIMSELRRRNIPLVRRVAANYLRVEVRTAGDPGRQVAELFVNETAILRLPDPSRVGTIAARLEQFFDADPDPSQISALRTAHGWEVVGGRALLMTLTPSDAAFLGLTIDEAARMIQARLQWIIRQDLRARQFTG